MKKTVSMLLAAIFAVIAVCTMAASAFAVGEGDIPDDPLMSTNATTTKAPESTTAAPTTEAPTTEAPTTEAPTTKAPASQTAKINDETKTNAPGKTAVDDGPETTRKPAPTEAKNPATGSNVAPVVALLALAAGVVAVVKTKKED